MKGTLWIGWATWVVSGLSRRPSLEFCNSPFLIAQNLRSFPLTNEKSFSSSLLKLRCRQNASGWIPSFIWCRLRGNTSGQFKKALETETGFWDGGWESDWKDHGNKTIFNFFKKLPFGFDVWLQYGYGDRVCSYFLDNWPFPSIFFLWENRSLSNAALWLTPHYSYSPVRLSNPPRLLLENALSSAQ